MTTSRTDQGRIHANDVIPVLVLTRAEELYQHASIGSTDMLLPVCSGDMLFNVFDEYMGLLG